MKIAKEVWLVVAIVAFLIAYLIDRLAGPVNITVPAPIAFLRSSYMLHTYPFTATAIIIRSFGLFVSTLLIVSSVMDKKYFTKAIILFFVGMLAEFFAIQQLATGFKLTTIQWTLAIAYGSFALILGIVFMILKGIWAMFNKEELVSPTNQGSQEDKSVLEPPTQE
jgi:hypothetical protein